MNEWWPRPVDSLVSRLSCWPASGSSASRRQPSRIARALGLRIALGSSRWGVVREALRGTAIVFAGGLAAGVVATIVAARQLDHVIAGLLIGLRPSDWLTMAAAAAAMIVVAVLAAILPALQAARTDPLITMRAN